ncbi:MAG: purine-nucleoside phosphorylase [Oscillospiraceae bacterium]|nr:purine-nucleoside phosphorylase [Oscillospiraceae bacterium]
MNPILKKLHDCRDYIRSVTDFQPEIGLVLGTGLGELAEKVENPTVIEYRDVPGFPTSTVASHEGRFVMGNLGGAPVIVMQGRVHYYEGYAIEDVVLPPRLMALLGIKVLFLTNASGGIDRDFHAGDFMMITDHILSFCPNPLIGPNIEELGVRFPDMSEVYDKELRRIITRTSLELDIPVKSGVYAQLTGPSFETPAEIRMLERLGASAVGMSTACEAVAARHMGVRVCGISFVSNPAAGISPNPLSHAEVIEAADKAAPLFRELVVGSIKNIHKSLSEV